MHPKAGGRDLKGTQVYPGQLGLTVRGSNYISESLSFPFPIQVGRFVAESFQSRGSIQSPGTDQGIDFSDDDGGDSDSGLEELVSIDS